MSQFRLIIVLLCSTLIHLILFVYLTNKLSFKMVDTDFDPINVEVFQTINSQAVNVKEKNQDKSSTFEKYTPSPQSIKESIIPKDGVPTEELTDDANNPPEQSEFDNSELCKDCLQLKKDTDVIDHSTYGSSIQSIHLRFMVFHDLGPNKQQRIEPFGQKPEDSIQARTKNHIGYVDIFYTREGDRYTLEFFSENIGLTNLYLNQLYQKSSGLISESGLKPLLYEYKYGERTYRQVSFDWQQKKAEINNKQQLKIKDLPPQTQDQLSVLFNFMFLDPLKTMNIPVTNGKNLKLYNYLYIDEGLIELNKNSFDFVHIEKISESKEKLEFWLAKNYGFLPIKIILTEDDSSLLIQELIEFKIDL